MEKVKVRDKYFAVSIPEAEIKRRVAELAAQISNDLHGRKPIFLSVLNGSFIFAADLLRGITTDCEITFIRLASYSGTSSTGEVQQLLGLNESLKGRTVVIVEDIIDSGLTMERLLASIRSQHPAEVRIAALLVKPDNMKTELDIPYCCFRIPNDFIVGYGLDYDGEGRNLPDIYTVVAD
ncbi:MAG: hypoxanthine phosphoribosyltransferase [Alloprevotella sp.]|nr:hypoxanthine phosphoribosyltransferase [Alloprevotella sp.]